MLTIVPLKYVKNFKDVGRIGNFNTLPQIHERAMGTIRNFVSENIGYDDLPLASLKCAQIGSLDGINFEDYLLVNSNDSVIFQLEIPDDMIVSVEYDKLLECSRNMFNCTDEFELDLEAEDLENSLILGIGDDSEGLISFIPFLDYNRCKFFAKLSKDFRAERGTLDNNISKIKLKKLSSFQN